jgi:hypothetical protein
MQLISVERWTFWSAVVLAVAGAPLSTGLGVWYNPNTGTSEGIGASIATAVFVLLVVSLVLGGSRDPAIRTVPPSPEP